MIGSLDSRVFSSLVFIVSFIDLMFKHYRCHLVKSLVHVDVSIERESLLNSHGGFTFVNNCSSLINSGRIRFIKGGRVIITNRYDTAVFSSSIVRLPTTQRRHFNAHVLNAIISQSQSHDIFTVVFFFRSSARNRLFAKHKSRI